MTGCENADLEAHFFALSQRLDRIRANIDASFSDADDLIRTCVALQLVFGIQSDLSARATPAMRAQGRAGGSHVRIFRYFYLHQVLVGAWIGAIIHAMNEGLIQVEKQCSLVLTFGPVGPTCLLARAAELLIHLREVRG